MLVGVVDPLATRELRRAVLRPDSAPGDPLPGDDLPGAVHLGAVDAGGAVLGTCFVFPQDCPWLPGRPGAWHLRQMATAPGHRGSGVGTAVLRAALQQAQGAGAPLLWCHARAAAEAFYARNGFRGEGELFVDAEHPILHRRMWRELHADATSSEG